MGTGGVLFTEIEAWQRLNHITLSPWELDSLLELDRLVVANANKKAKEKSK